MMRAREEPQIWRRIAKVLQVLERRRNSRSEAVLANSNLFLRVRLAKVMKSVDNWSELSVRRTRNGSKSAQVECVSVLCL